MHLVDLQTQDFRGLRSECFKNIRSKRASKNGRQFSQISPSSSHRVCIQVQRLFSPPTVEMSSNNKYEVEAGGGGSDLGSISAFLRPIFWGLGCCQNPPAAKRQREGSLRTPRAAWIDCSRPPEPGGMGSLLARVGPHRPSRWP